LQYEHNAAKQQNLFIVMRIVLQQAMFVAVDLYACSRSMAKQLHK
jgi:hypothetical protein